MPTAADKSVPANRQPLAAACNVVALPPRASRASLTSTAPSMNSAHALQTERTRVTRKAPCGVWIGEALRVAAG